MDSSRNWMFCHISGLVFDDVSGATREELSPDIVRLVNPGVTTEYKMTFLGRVPESCL